MQQRTMTRDEFISYAYEVLFGEGSEQLWEQIAEARSEIAMYGDAGPGALYRLRESVQEYNSIADRYEKLTGDRVVARPVLPSPR